MTVQGDAITMPRFGGVLFFGARVLVRYGDSNAQCGDDCFMKGRLRSFSPDGLAAFQRGVERAAEVRRRQRLEWCRSFAPFVLELLKEGYPGMKVFAAELNERGLKTRRGSRWTHGQVSMLFGTLIELGVLSEGYAYPVRKTGPISQCNRSRVEGARRASTERADTFALSLVPTIDALQRAGYTSHPAIARELNRRCIATRQGKAWDPYSVRALVDRIRSARERLRRANPHATGVHNK